MKAEIWIAQYIPNVFKMEPINVGVILRAGDQIVARFVGEDKDKNLDLNKTNIFNYPLVYREWVDYWRSELEENKLDSLVNGVHYRLIFSGYVNVDSTLEDALDFSFSLMIEGE